MSSSLKILAVGLILLISNSALTAEQPTITINTGDWPPYISSNLPNHGCLGELITRSFSSVGFASQFVYLPGKRTYTEAKNGNADATAYWFESKERKQDFYYSEQNVTSEDTYFYYLKDSGLKLDSYQDMEGKSLALNRGLTYNETFWNEVNSREITQVALESEKQNLLMLLSKRVDYAIVSEKTADHYLAKFKSEDRKKIVRSPNLVVSAKGYVLFPKVLENSILLKKKFDEGLIQVRKNKAFMKKYKALCGPL